MDSHSFGDPVPVVTATKEEEEGTAEPSWTVDVIRIRGNVVVGTLLISNSTLPPRKNKKNKIVWRLPDSIHGDLPRFGEQDKKRLWELFKEQKKKRRKSQSKGNDKEEEEEDEESNVDHFVELQGTAESVSFVSPSVNVLNPPPGFECSNPSSSADDAATLLEHVSISASPPGINSAAAVTSSFSECRQQCISVPACGSTNALALILGAAVFDRFRHLVEGTDSRITNDPESVTSLLNLWLECYTADATQSLLVGSAHTTAVTPTSRRDLWYSVLCFSPGGHKKYWTCRGWTAVPVQTSAVAEGTILMVLNGTTIQMETELLSYTLTLLLLRTTKFDETTHHYVIVNAILTLQPTPTAS